MKNKHVLWIALFGFLALLGVLAACGGGGGDNDGGGVEIPYSYTGRTDQAVITADNAVAIVQHLSSYGYITEPIDEVAIGIIDEAGLITDPRDIHYLRVVGVCGGYYILQLQFNKSTDSFTGNVKFVDYCVDWWDNNLYLTGTVPFDGSLVEKQETLRLVLRLTVDDISSRIENDSRTLTYDSRKFTYGTVKISLAEVESGNYIFNYVLRDNYDQFKTYWTDDTGLTSNYVYDGAYNEFILGGRFYDNDYGFIDIVTDEKIIVWPVEPKTGVISILGKESKAKLTFKADGSALLEVDADNDGAFDDGSFETEDMGLFDKKRLSN
jgi:hypothetical protein